MKYLHNAITIKEETFITPQAANVTAPAASEGDVTGTYIQVQALAVVVQIVTQMEQTQGIVK